MDTQLRIIELELRAQGRPLQAVIDEDRLRSARAFQVGPPSGIIVSIATLARWLHRWSAAVEAWATAPRDTAGPAHPPVKAR